jgi:hypothetical protein
MYKKFVVSILLIILVFISFTNAVDDISTKQLDTAFKRSITVFAIARGLNGLISVVQGTEVYATPAGVGVNFAVGQVLDPLNDMVERFSWVMLISSVSLGVQEVVLALGKTDLVQFSLALSALVIIVMLWFKQLWHKTGFNLIFKGFIIVVFLRFTVPLIVLLNSAFFNYALEPQYESAKTALEVTKIESENLVQKVQEKKREEHSWIASLNVSKQLDEFRLELKVLWKSLHEKFSSAINYMLSLITIFIIESILFPLIALWAFMRLFREFLSLDIALMFEKK